MRIKICGITQPEQGKAITAFGATALGFICARQTPRYVEPKQIRAIVDYLADCFPDAEMPALPDRVGVFVDAPLAEIVEVVAIAGLNGVQLHGQESPEFCQQVRQALPDVELFKALRVRGVETLEQAKTYQDGVDTLLLDAYHPKAHGGTGKTLDWQSLQTFRVDRPWFLSGGLTPANVQTALKHIQPDGIDLSSGVEIAPGNKDLNKVKQLFQQLALL
jgi:phosphoribosylanthranilate isomerase